MESDIAKLFYDLAVGIAANLLSVAIKPAALYLICGLLGVRLLARERNFPLTVFLKLNVAVVAVASCIPFSVGIARWLQGGVALDQAQPGLLLASWLIYLPLAFVVGMLTVSFLSAVQDGSPVFSSEARQARSQAFMAGFLGKTAIILFCLGWAFLFADAAGDITPALYVSAFALLLIDVLSFARVLTV